TLPRPRRPRRDAAAGTLRRRGDRRRARTGVGRDGPCRPGRGAVVPPGAAPRGGARGGAHDPAPRRAPAGDRQAARDRHHAARSARPRQRPGAAAPRHRHRDPRAAAPAGPAHRRGARLRDPARGAPRLSAAVRPEGGRQVVRGPRGAGAVLVAAAAPGGATDPAGPPGQAARRAHHPRAARGAERDHRARGARGGRRRGADGPAAAHGPHAPAACAARLPRSTDPGGGPVLAHGPGAAARPAVAGGPPAPAVGTAPGLRRSGHRRTPGVPQRAGAHRGASYSGTVTDPRSSDPSARVPAPRRTRSGQVVVGPTVRARYAPAALIGLPLVSVLLSTFAGAGLQQWRSSRLRDGHDGLLEQLLAPAWAQLLLGALALWGLLALWALVPLVLTHRVVLFDERTGALTL